VKKWWTWALVFLLALAALIFWGARPSRAITVVTHGGFKVYDVRYFRGTNRIFYWRAAWRDALGLVGLMKIRPIDSGPALVIYSSEPTVVGPGPRILMLWSSGGWIAKSSTEYFASNQLVTKFFFEDGPMTNGVYHVTFLDTKVADITVSFKN
jgi:hypothetical protein